MIGDYRLQKKAIFAAVRSLQSGYGVDIEK